MELRDYARMLRRGWLAIVLITALVVGLALLYLALTPKRYESSTVLFVSASNLTGPGDLQTGALFSSNAVVTYAKVIDSSTVLGPVAAQTRPPTDVDSLIANVSAAVPENTTLIEIAVGGSDPEQVTNEANVVAASAIQVIPTLETTVEGRPLVRVQQIRQAIRPVKPISPDSPRILAIGFVVGLCLGLGMTIAAQTLDTRIRQVDHVPALTEVPLLAVLPRLRRGQRHGIVVRDEPAGATGEAFRTLRTNLRFLESKDRRSMVFTAVSDDRDGVMVPANLAYSLVQAGWRVLLVDLDLRHSPVGDAFAVRGVPGLADILMNQADLSDVVRDTTNPRLKLVTSGTPQVSPADLLSAPSMTNVLRRMEQAHDYVILHAPPLLSYTDAALVSDAAGGTFLTVAAGHTRGHELTTALGVLANVRVKPLGVVLTGVRQADRHGSTRARNLTNLSRRQAPVKAPSSSANVEPEVNTDPARRSFDPPTLRHHPARPVARGASTMGNGAEIHGSPLPGPAGPGIPAGQRSAVPPDAGNTGPPSPGPGSQGGQSGGPSPEPGVPSPEPPRGPKPGGGAASEPGKNGAPSPGPDPRRRN